MADKPVTLTEAAERSLVSAMAADKGLIEAIVDAVTRHQQMEFLEQLKQFALQEAQLTKLREENSRKDQTIRELHQRIAQLNSFLSSMSTGSLSCQVATAHQASVPAQMVVPAWPGVETAPSQVG